MSTPSPRSSALENCNVKHHNGYITASCVYPQNSAASDFQAILQFNDPENLQSVYRLMVNQTLNRNTSISFSVERSGTYCVIIFAVINGEMLDGNPSFLVELQVETDQGQHGGVMQIHVINYCNYSRKHIFYFNIYSSSREEQHINTMYTCTKSKIFNRGNSTLGNHWGISVLSNSAAYS